MRNHSNTIIKTPNPRAKPVAADLGTLGLFVAAALGIGGPLLWLSTQAPVDAPFLLATILFGLAAPALVLTYRERGRSGVHALLRDSVRLPTRKWWLPLAGFGLPVLTWVTGAAMGGSQPLSWGLVGFYVADLAINAVLINIWEEMAWTGFFQRRAASRWGLVGGSLVTSAFFFAIHVPLVLGTASGAHQVANDLVMLAGVAVAVRILIARIDPWCGYSVLTVGVLHASFNASENLLDSDHFWVRVAVTILLGIAVIAFGRNTPKPSGQDWDPEVARRRVDLRPQIPEKMRPRGPWRRVR